MGAGGLRSYRPDRLPEAGQRPGRQRLAEYRTERVRIDLTDDERAQYEADYMRIFPCPSPARDTWAQAGCGNSRA